MGKLGGSTRGAEHDSISVLSISALLPPDGVRAGDEVRLMLRREARRGRTTKQLLLAKSHSFARGRRAYLIAREKELLSLPPR